MTPCLEWAGELNPAGYGKVALGDRKRAYAHRRAWSFENGPIPCGMVIMHECDNPACVRLDHLKLGTQKQNLTDASARLRFAKQSAAACKQGHAFTCSYKSKHGIGSRRICRECLNVSNRKYRARMASAAVALEGK